MRGAVGTGAARWTSVGIGDFLEGYARHWDALNVALYGGHPLFDSRFVFALLRHFPSPSVTAWVLGDPGQPRGILLLEQGRAGVWSSFQRSQAQASPVLLAPQDLGALPDLFRALSPAAQIIDFYCQDPHYSPWHAGSAGLPAISSAHTLTASISLDGGFEEYWRARPKGLRQTISRSLKRAAAEGNPVTLRAVEDPALIGEAVREFGLLESRGWKGACGTAVSPDNAQGRFYAEVFEAFGRANQAVAYELYAGDRAIARQLALYCGPMCITLKTTHDEDYRRLSPGRVLDYEMLKLEFARRRFDRMELYTDADAAQLRWTTSDRWVEHVTCFRSTVAKTAYTMARSALARLRRLRGDRGAPSRDH